MRNLTWFWGGLGVAATAASVAVEDAAGRRIVVALLLVGGLGGLVVGATWSRPRFLRALRTPDHPRIRNWPRTPAQRATADRLALKDARRAVVIAAVVGAIGGLVPLLGPVLAATGAAGAAGTLVVVRAVQRYEQANDAIVLTGAVDRAVRDRRRALVVGVVDAADGR